MVIKPTGGYERRVVDVLLATHLSVVEMNAKQVRQFARACGQLSKTDRTVGTWRARFWRDLRPDRSSSWSGCPTQKG